jgi:hypothetical protein
LQIMAFLTLNCVLAWNNQIQRWGLIINIKKSTLGFVLFCFYSFIIKEVHIWSCCSNECLNDHMFLRNKPPCKPSSSFDLPNLVIVLLLMWMYLIHITNLK